MKAKNIQSFMFMAVSLFFVVVPAFHVCHELVDGVLFSPIPAFEQEHPHEMSSERQDTHNTIAPFVWALISPGTNFFQQNPHPLFPIISPNQQNPILRC
jgi:hypothetical protein